jgi:CubicO group peptidase (beta-lactamase class C family)
MQHNLKLPFLYLLIFLLTACGGEQWEKKRTSNSANTAIDSAKLAQIDQYVQAQMRRQTIPGLSLAVNLDGKSVLQKAYGTRDVGTKALVTPNTIFQIGSVTKQFTAASIMLLVQDGRLNLDQSIKIFFPELPAEWAGITVRHLLQHTAGLYRGEEHLEVFDAEKNYSANELVLAISKIPLRAAPGVSFEYSNIGYMVLGALIEKLSGKAYFVFLRERIFTPLKMDSAAAILSSSANADIATGYTMNEGSLIPIDYSPTLRFWLSLISGTGGLQMSAPDLAKWDLALNSEQILSKASLMQMWAPAKLQDGSSVPYGFAWLLGEINHQAFVSHNGSIFGFTSHFERHAAQRLSVIVLVNGEVQSLDKLTAKIAAIIDPSLDWVPANDSNAQRGVLVRQLMDELVLGKLLVDHRFTAEMQAILDQETVSTFNERFKTFGKVERFFYVKQTKIGEMDLAIYLAESAFDRVMLVAQVDANGKISFLGIN